MPKNNILVKKGKENLVAACFNMSPMKREIRPILTSQLCRGGKEMYKKA